MPITSPNTLPFSGGTHQAVAGTRWPVRGSQVFIHPQCEAPALPPSQALPLLAFPASHPSGSMALCGASQGAEAGGHRAGCVWWEDCGRLGVAAAGRVAEVEAEAEAEAEAE